LPPASTGLESVDRVMYFGEGKLAFSQKISSARPIIQIHEGDQLKISISNIGKKPSKEAINF